MKLFRMRRSCKGNTYVAELTSIERRRDNRLMLPADDHYALEAWERMSTGGVSVDTWLMTCTRILFSDCDGLYRLRWVACAAR